MQSIGKNISVLYRQLNVFLNRELGSADISATELMYLASLYRQNGITQDELANEYCIDKAATARTIQKMERKGLVRRIADTEDKRAKKVLLTDKALKYREMIFDIQNKWLKEIHVEIPKEEINIFVKVLSSAAEKIKELNQA